MKITKIECSSCGHPLEFKQGDEMVTCKYCGCVYSIEYDKNLKQINSGKELGDSDGDYVIKPLNTNSHPNKAKQLEEAITTVLQYKNIIVIIAVIGVVILMFLLLTERKNSVQNIKVKESPTPILTPSSSPTSSPTPVPSPTSTPVQEQTQSQTPILTALTDLSSIEDYPSTTNRLKDNYGNEYKHAIINDQGYTGSAGPITYEYLINSKYQLIKGTLYIPEGESDDGTSTLVIRGDGHTIYTSPSLDKKSRPESFEVNIVRFNDIQIEWSNNSGYHNISGLHCCLGDTYFVYDETLNANNKDNSSELLPYSILDLESIYTSVSKSKRLTDNYGNRYSNAIYNRVDNYHYNSVPIYEYLLDQKFTHFSGVLYIPEGLTFSSPVKMLVYKDDVLIYTSSSFTSDSGPESFDIDITGCNDLKITYSNSSWYDSSSDQTICLANAYLVP